MRRIVIPLALAAVAFAPAAFAQTKQPDVSNAPSAQNSGAGIPGKPGSESGPAVEPGTVGASSTKEQIDPTTRLQDPAKVEGMRGTESGPPAKQPENK